MKILRLSLENFRGVRSFVFEPNGKDASVYGENAAGKTSLADGFFWLITGKDSLNNAKFKIKPLDKQNREIHNLHTVVEGEFLLASGQRLMLRKTFREKWETKRGSAQQEFGGHTVDHVVNHVPVDEKEYLAQVASFLADERKLRILTDPAFFNSDGMKTKDRTAWQERRRFLLEMCGDISDGDVIAENPELAEVADVIGAHSLDNYKKIVVSRHKELNEELKKLPVRIDEALRSIPTVPTATIDRGELDSKLQALQERRAQISEGGEAARISVQLIEIEGAMKEIALRIKSEVDQRNAEALQAPAGLDRQIQGLEMECAKLRTQVLDAEGEIARLEPKIVRLREQYVTENQKGYTGADSCPACGQSLPEERVQGALEEFNLAKSQKLADISAEGKALRAKKEGLEPLLQKLTSELAEKVVSLDALRSWSARSRASFTREEVDLDSNAYYGTKAAERAALVEKRQALQQDSGAALMEVDEEIASVRADLQQIENAQAAKRLAEATQSRIEELQVKQKDLRTECERLERELYLLEQFVRTRVSLLTERINDRFDSVRWKLFEEQLNGGLQDVCVATVNGVPYDSGLNTGARINAGLECIRTFQSHFEFHPPVFVDGCESVTRLTPMDCQVVRLVVSEPDKELRIETSAKEAQEALAV